MAKTVAQALDGFRDQAMNMAEETIRRRIADVEKMLRENNWDINAAYPYPKNPNFLFAMIEYQFANSVVEYESNIFSRNQPRIVEMSAKRIKRAIEETRRDAAMHYDSFIAKLETKLKKNGGYTNAEIAERSVWEESYLIITLPNGKTEVWVTRMIMNTSKYGKVFPQFPTRKVKALPKKANR